MTKRYPFKFLDSYGKTDTDIFFGRDPEIEALYEMTFQSDILLVYGASGTGKTSLINCGLASRFQAHDWLALSIRRGNDLNAALQQKLEEAASGADSGAADLDLSWLDEDEESTEAPSSALSQQLQAIYRQYFRPIYLIFDQFEELYVLGSKAEQTEFIRHVQEIQSVEHPVKMIFVIREEYLGHLFEFERSVPQLLRKKLRVEPMNLDKVGQVVRGSAQLNRSNIRLQAGQETAIIEGIFQKIKGKEQTLAIQLPYLQVFLDKLYLHITGDEFRQADALFTTQALSEIGDIGDVLRNFLEEQAIRIQKTLAGRHADLPEDTVWQILSPLATLEGTKEPMLENTLIKRLPTLPPAVVSEGLRLLEQQRILRFDENEGRYEVAHDSLAARIAEHRNDDEIAILEIRRLVSSQMGLKAEARELFSKKQLNLIDPYLGKLGLEVEALELIEQSRRGVFAAAYRKRRRNAIIGSLVVILLILSVYSNIQTQRALDGLQKTTAQIFDYLLLAADEDILQLDYAAAQEKIQNAADLQVNDQKVGQALMEIVYFYNETGQYSSALSLTKDLRQLLGTARLRLDQDTLSSVRNYLKNTNVERYDFLRKRYFPEMIPVEGGIVTVGRYTGQKIAGFKMAKYETTNWQYNLFCLNSGQDSLRPAGWGVGGNIPVVNVSWEDAIRYTNWLSIYEGGEKIYSGDIEPVEWDTTAQRYRLPTEAEWEYAARGGTRQDSFTYSGSNNLDSVGWYNSNSNSRPQAIGTKNANSLRLSDMRGNVWEWCWDNYKPGGSRRVFRGGSWINDAKYADVSYRSYNFPSYRSSTLGFRLVCSLQFNE